MAWKRRAAMKRYALIGLLALLGACGKINAENYAKVEMGMSYEEASAILGKAERCDDTAGFKTCEWSDGQSSISLQFVGDRLMVRSAKNLR
jgi:hypothetical protein